MLRWAPLEMWSTRLWGGLCSNQTLGSVGDVSPSVAGRGCALMPAGSGRTGSASRTDGTHRGDLRAHGVRRSGEGDDYMRRLVFIQDNIGPILEKAVRAGGEARAEASRANDNLIRRGIHTFRGLFESVPQSGK
jgi:hypothetical protein